MTTRAEAARQNHLNLGQSSPTQSTKLWNRLSTELHWTEHRNTELWVKLEQKPEPL
jgi:hypothetical protein